MSRLQLLGSDLRAEINGATDDRRREMAIAVARYLAMTLPGLPLEITQRTADFVHPTDDLRRAAAGAAEQSDDRYLDLHDDEKPGGQTVGWESAFRLARGASAIAFALDPDPILAVSEAVYEAHFALAEDDDVLLQLLQTAPVLA